MEAINKTISLEQFYSRQKSTIPFVGMDENEYYPDLNWGKVAYGVDFDSLLALSGSTATNIYGPGIRKLGVMTYQEMMAIYHQAKNGNGGNVEGEELEKMKSIVAFIDSKKIIEEPKPIPDPCCDPCAVPSPPAQYEMDSGDFYIPPTANISISLVQSANIIGAYTFATKDWVEGKRYFAGDKVIYDGKTFILKEFDGTTPLHGRGKNCNDDWLMTVGFYTGNSANSFFDIDPAYGGLSEAIFEEFIVNDEQEIVDMGYIYAKVGETYYVRPSWGGFNNTYDGKIYFDVLYDVTAPEEGFQMRGQYNTVHWKLAEDIFSHGAYTVSSCGEDGGLSITAEQNRDIGFDEIDMTGLTWESKLVNFKRNTKSVTYEGEELPGKFPSSTATTLDLQYVVGTIKNIDTSGERVFGDILNKITLVTDDGNSKTLTTDSPILSGMDAWENKEGYITFEYYIGADLEKEDESNPDSDYIYNDGNTGLIYHDKYRFKVLKDTQILDKDGTSAATTFYYVDIDYASAESEVVMENVDNYHVDVRMSEIESRGKQSMTEGGNPVSQDFQNADYFMEDYQLGISFVANNNENVYIDRGSATAFERHMRLSEVDTMQDLELYGNGMFKLKE